MAYLMNPFFFDDHKEVNEKGVEEEKKEPLKNMYIYCVKEEDFPNETPAAQEKVIESRLGDDAKLVNSILAGNYYFKISKDQIADKSSIKKTECFGPIEVTKKKDQKIYLPLHAIKVRIGIEYKIIPLYKDLSQYQDASESVKISANPVRVMLYINKCTCAAPYSGKATITCDNLNMSLYRDKELKTEFKCDSEKLSYEELTGDIKPTFYLKGNTAGKIKFKVELEKSDKKEHEPVVAEEEFCVSGLAFELYEYDDANPPAEKILSDEDKIKKGRLLHDQNSGNNGRAKLVIKKIDTSSWPTGCDKYRLLLSHTGSAGKVSLFDSEENGTKLVFPYKIAQKDYSANDLTFWVEGASDSEAFRDALVDLGIERDKEKSDVIDPLEPVRNADAARFTVVTIEKVVPEKEFASPSADYSGNKFKYYINVDDLRKIKIKASLTKKLPGVKLHFMLAPNKDNGKAAISGENFPATWTAIGDAIKQKDKANTADYFHLSEDTDANGCAVKEVEVSRFGRDHFKAGVYISQDVHLAKYKEGDPTDGKRKPVLSNNIIVWRKAWYQMTSADGFNPPDPGTSETSYNTVGVDLKKSSHEKFLKASHPDRTFFPEYMFKVGGGAGDVAVIGSHNKSQFWTYFKAKADEPYKAHIVICEYQYDEGATVTKTFNIAASPSTWISMGKTIVSPALQASGLVVAGTWELVSDPTKNGNITNADITIDATRTGLDKIKVTLPAGAPVPTALDPVSITLELRWADGPYLGESSGQNILCVYDSSNVADYNDTITHEIGHSFSQVVKPGNQHSSLPTHPYQYMSQGSHCSWSTRNCVMYESGPIPTCIHKFCPECHCYMLVQDMEGFNKTG